MKKILFIIPVLFAVAVSLCSCEENPLPSENKTEVKGISVQTTSIPSLFVGDTQEIKFTLNPSNANTAYLKWISTDAKKATVSGGFVTGVSEGDTEIRIYLMDSVDDRVANIVDTLAKIPVHVDNVLASEVAIYTKKDENVKTLSVYKNKVTETISFGVRPGNATVKTATWTTADKAKAMFQLTAKDKDGKPLKDKAGKDSTYLVSTVDASSVIIKALDPGTVVITAKAKDGTNKTASFTLTVENVDDLNVWASDAAGSQAIIGGDNPDIKAENGHFLSYSKGVVSWDENTTGAPRTDTLVIPATTSQIVVTQLEAKDFVGNWDFYTKVFASNTNLGISAGVQHLTLSIAAKEGSTASDGSKNITNNLAVTGLCSTYVAEAVADIDYDSQTLRFGIFFNGKKAQEVNTGKTGYGYLALLPEYGTGWGSYNFAPFPFNSGANAAWLWFVMDDVNNFHYGQNNWYKMDGKDVLGLSFCACSKESPAASDFAQAVNSTKYDVIHQCNPVVDPGFTLKRK